MSAIRTSHEQGKASLAMRTTLSGSETKPRRVPEKAADSMGNRNLDSNKIKESGV
jgi:hypothetical protein